jgi:hypothetical protein
MRILMLAIATVVIGAALLVAQVPVDTGIVLIEAGIELGEIYRGPGPADASVYTEHWILRPGYVYPGPKTLTTLNLVPKASTPYSSEEDFFKNASFPKGSTYVRVTAEEFDRLPVQR